MGDESLYEVVESVIGNDFVTNYIVAVEVMTAKGMDLRLVCSDTMSPWHATGMLQVASEMIQTSQKDDEE
jgi:uncharacterized protein YrzB (UPF0473 family)